MDYIIDSTTEQLHSTGGIALAGKIFERIHLGTDEVGGTLKHPYILRAVAGLFVQGRTRYEEIGLFREDPLFQQSLGLPFVPAPETLRLYLEHRVEQQEKVQQAVHCANQRLLQRAPLTAVEGKAGRYLPLDIDTTVLDNSKSHKEGVSRTYRQVDGYHPILSYLGAEGYIVTGELREGKQHCQRGTPEFLRRTLSVAKTLSRGIPLVVRMDAGHDAQETLRVLEESGEFFVVKRNPRRENPSEWLEVAQREGEIAVRDSQQTVYRGVRRYSHANETSSPVSVVYEVTVRHQAEDGTPLRVEEVEVQSFWTNLPESPEEVLRLYQEHGTSEQFHSELKSDMNIERLPSGKFAVNAMLFQLALLAYNTLRFLGQRAIEVEELLPYKTGRLRKRLRKVIDDLVRIAVKVVRHAKRIYLKLWQKNPWVRCFQHLYGVCARL